MNRGTLMVAAGIVLGAVGMTAARHDEKHEPGRPLSVREIVEKLDGKETSATAVEVTLRARPGGRAAPPSRAGVRVRPGGRVRVGDRRPAGQGAQGGRDVLRAGRLPAPGVEEPGERCKMRMLAWVLHPRDAKDLVIPVKK